MQKTFDVDIDAVSCDREKYGTRAMIHNEETMKIMPHPSGIYMDEVLIDDESGLATFDYAWGEANGFQKVDILNNNSYKIFNSKQDVLIHKELDIDWSCLEDRELVETLPHISKHYETVNRVKPQSVEDLADVLALIRPGKIHLLDDYINNKNRVRKNLYKRPSSGMYFKKSHAIGYAMMIRCVISKKQNGAGIKW